MGQFFDAVDELAKWNVIKQSLIQAGQGKVADELSKLFAALDEKMQAIQQYYEEFLIPKIEQEAWADRVEESSSPAERKDPPSDTIQADNGDTWLETMAREDEGRLRRDRNGWSHE